MLFPHLTSFPPRHGTRSEGALDARSGPPGRRVQVQQRSLSYAGLAAQATALAHTLPARGRVAVLAEREIETVVAVVAGLLRGATVIPVNPAATVRELAHVMGDSTPDLVLLRPAAAEALEREAATGGAGDHPLAAVAQQVIVVVADEGAGESADARGSVSGVDGADEGADGSASVGGVEGADDGNGVRRAGAGGGRVETVGDDGASAEPGSAASMPLVPLPEPDPETPALVMYTSGTTGPPKGAVLSHRAIAANLDMLAEVWAWSPDDVLVHALPLYHVHGLVLGVLGALRVGSGLHHLGAFDARATASALDAGGTMHFGVPTIYHRLAEAAAADPTVATALAGARLLVSGSAGLPAPVHEQIRQLTGHTIVERYGMTETMITTAVPAGVTDKAGTVGPALPGVDLRVVDDRGADVAADAQAMGEIVVRTPAMFSGYLGHGEQNKAPDPSTWFRTGDTATIDADGYVRIVGRSSVDIIKSGGFKIGAGEIEDVLLGHASVAEVAVRGVADEVLGERVVAWVVLRAGAATTAAELIEHTRPHLSRHKQPRDVILVDELPRNAMGKVQKSRLTVAVEPTGEPHESPTSAD